MSDVQVRVWVEDCICLLVIECVSSVCVHILYNMNLILNVVVRENYFHPDEERRLSTPRSSDESR